MEKFLKIVKRADLFNRDLRVGGYYYIADFLAINLWFATPGLKLLDPRIWFKGHFNHLLLSPRWLKSIQLKSPELKLGVEKSEMSSTLMKSSFYSDFFLYVDENNECPRLLKEHFRPTPYAFRHYFSLSDDINEFQTIIEGIEPSKSMPANIDSPESGLDAMAQAMLCQGKYNH